MAVPAEVGLELPSIKRLITQERIEQYAAASGDFNPIHVNHEFAARSQFGSTIAHGMMIAATISEMMAVAFPESWPSSGRLKLRFRAPVLRGEVVETTGRVKSVREKGNDSIVTCAVEVRKPDGQPAIAGEASVALTG